MKSIPGSGSKLIFRRENILERVRPFLSAWTPLQTQVDGLAGGFVHQATDVKSLAALTAGGMAYRLGRMGTLAGRTGPLTRFLSVGLGLGAEVTVFELAHRGLNFENLNLWRWSGSGGLKEGLLSSLVTFATLKGFGKLAQGQNLILQHGAQDLAMVTGHQLAHEAGIGPRPQGSFVDQMLHAEATNWQLKAGMALVHRLAPGIHEWERGLDLSVPFMKIPPSSLSQSRVGRDLAFASAGRGAIPSSAGEAELSPSKQGAFRDRLDSSLNPLVVRIQGEWKESRPPSPPIDKAALGLGISRFRREYERISRRLESVFARLEQREAESYLKDLDDLSRRQRFWEEQLKALEKEPADERGNFERDIEIGLKLLTDRLLRVGAEIFQEPLSSETRSHWGLKTQFNKCPFTKGDRLPGHPTPEGILPALVNRDVGFGRTLSFRPHQEAALYALRGRLALREAQIQDVKESEELSFAFLSGTIVMPVGGGKTRTMMGAFAIAIEKGLFQAGRGDKLIILNHTEQIHEQNREVTELLEPYFRKNFGRALKVSEYKADQRDLAGDVIVVSIPSVNNEARRERFTQELKAALGEQGEIAMVAVDEVHHMEMGKGRGKESWAQLLSSLRGIDPQFYQIGFTATPTGREGGVIFRIREQDLMKVGVTPRTYLVKIEGEDLSQLKISQGTGEFEPKELTSTLLSHPQRNQRIYEVLERQGLQKEIPTPRGKAQLEPTLVFGADLKHARQMAEGYVEYFKRPVLSEVEKEGTGSISLHNRRIILLGGEKGKITSKELEKALQSYRRGEIDGIAAIISGVTKGQKNPVLEAVEKGEIEAVFTVDALVEGADLYMFTHQVGARPTFSRIKKGQERGRINRRGPDEVTLQGKLLKDPPRILFDVVDRYASHERSLSRYGEVMGIIGHTNLETNRLLDAFSCEVVNQVNRSGEGIRRPRVEELNEENESRHRPRPQIPKESPWANLVELLKMILHEKYGNDLESLALDLGETREFVEALLQGEGWENNRWFLKRLATLLYEERGKFLSLYNQDRELGDEAVTPVDYALLRSAVALYEKWESPNGEKGIEIRGDWGWGEQKVVVAPNMRLSLSLQTLGGRSYRVLWRGMALYLHSKGKEGTNESIVRRAQEKYAELVSHLFQRQGWNQGAASKQEELLLLARQRVAQGFGGSLPTRTGIEGVALQREKSPLTRWLKGHERDYSSKNTPHFFYGQVRALLKGLGVSKAEVEEKIEEAIFEERGWEKEAKTQGEKLLRIARKKVAHRFGGDLVINTGIEGVAQQKKSPSLTPWLKGRERKYSKKNTPQSFYGQVRALLKGLGVSKRTVEEMIEGAIFEERGWEREANTRQENLLLMARKKVAQGFGGVLPYDTGIMGVANQGEKSSLARWLKGEKRDLDDNLIPQIRALLTHENFMPQDEVERLLEGALAEIGNENF